MSDRGQTLNVCAEYGSDGGGLGFAQLWELVSDVRDRAVLLAQLLGSVPFEQRDLAHRGDVALLVEDPSQDRRRRQTRVGVTDSLEALADELGSLVGEGTHRRTSAIAFDEPQGLRRELVVLLVETFAAVIGQEELFGRASATSGLNAAQLTRLDGAFVEQLLKVPSDGCRGQVETLAEGRRGGRPVHQE